MGDLDGDGKPELAVANWANTLNSFTLYKNTTSGNSVSFTLINTIASGGTGPRDVIISDIDGDGKLDLAVENQGSSSGNIAVFKNTSTGVGNFSFASSQLYNNGGAIPYALATGDLDGDGKLDMATSFYVANTLSVSKHRFSNVFVNTYG